VQFQDIAFVLQAQLVQLPLMPQITFIQRKAIRGNGILMLGN
jgi:hypothetical protein